MADYIELGTTAVVAISAFKAIEYIVKILKPKNGNGNKDERQDNKITQIDTLFQEHCKVQTEAFATVHNGLNTASNSIKDLTDKLAKNTEAIAVLSTIIQERIPKRIPKK